METNGKEVQRLRKERIELQMEKTTLQTHKEQQEITIANIEEEARELRKQLADAADASTSRRCVVPRGVFSATAVDAVCSCCLVAGIKTSIMSCWLQKRRPGKKQQWKQWQRRKSAEHPRCRKGVVVF